MQRRRNETGLISSVLGPQDCSHLLDNLHARSNKL